MAAQACPCFSSSSVLQMNVASLSRAIANKEVACQELMEATLDRIADINSTYNAIILMREKEELMALARTADNTVPVGLLHGIPIAVKDLSNVEGIPTTMGGSPLFEDFVPDHSDVFVENMIKSGAIIIGKTNTPECGMGSHTFNTRWGTTSNPFDESKSAGGSSGGAAVAVATNMLCIADGTDMMGSLRNPAGWNNLYSLRPTAGLIPESRSSQKNPLPYPISTPGPIARTPLDCALFLQVLAGKQRFDASNLTGEAAQDKIRIGWLGDWNDSIPFDEGILSRCSAALGTFAGDDVHVEDISDSPMFPMHKLWKSWNNVRFAVAYDTYSKQFPDQDLLSNDAIKEDMRWELWQGLQVSSADLEDSTRIQKDYGQFLDFLFAKYDILALPSAQVWPFPKDSKWPATIDGVAMDTYHRWMEVCVPASFGGLPCATVPAGFGENRLPMGLQLLARRGEDKKLIEVACRYHERNNLS